MKTIQYKDLIMRKIDKVTLNRFSVHVFEVRKQISGLLLVGHITAATQKEAIEILQADF